jgi:beta-glucosidase
MILWLNFTKTGEANIELIWNYGLHDYQKDFNDALKQAQNADYIIVTAGIHEGNFRIVLR